MLLTARFSRSVDIGVPPADVWAVMTDVERWPEWTASVRTLKKLDEGPLAVGSRVRIKQPRLPPSVLEVTDVRQDRGFTWVARSPGVKVVADHRIERSGHGSRVALSVDFRGPFGPLVGWLTRTLTKRYLDLEAAGLKRRCEGR